MVHPSTSQTTFTTSLPQHAVLESDVGRTGWMPYASTDATKRKKAPKIAMMRVIYKSTQEAVIRLGLAEDESDLANTLLWWLQQKILALYRSFQELNTGRQLWPDNQDGTPDFRNIMAFVATGKAFLRQKLVNWMNSDDWNSPLRELLRAHGKEEWPAMFKLWSRPWFQRLWTVQEFILPPKALFVCGGQQLTAETFKICIVGLATLMVDDLKRVGRNEEVEFAMLGFRKVIGKKFHAELKRRQLLRGELPVWMVDWK